MLMNRCKLKKGTNGYDDYWSAQMRFELFWFIPTPFWVDYWHSYGDIVMGNILEPVWFKTEEECINWFKENEIELL